MNNIPISAQVILKEDAFPSPATDGLKADNTTPEKVMSFFSTQGFDVGNMVANNFSITSAGNHFENFFATKIEDKKKSGLFAMSGKSRLLPLKSLPLAIRQHVADITFGEPPELF